MSSDFVWTGMLAAIFLLTACSLISTPEEDIPENVVQESVWVDSYELKKGRHWIRISEAGDALFIKFGTPGTKQLTDVRTGRISSTETEQLFRLIEEIDFFSMEDREPADIVEADIVNVGACQNGNCHEISARPPTAVPDQLEKLIAAVETHISALEQREGETVLISGDVISSERVRELKEEGHSFVSYDRVENYAAVRTVVEYPGQFMRLEQEAVEELQEEVDAANYFYVSLSDQVVGVDFYYFNREN